MSQKTASAFEFLKRRYIGDDKKRLASLGRELIGAEVARQIYDARRRAGLSQHRLAKLVGTTQSAISRLENADYGGHSLRTLNRVAQALGVRLDVRLTAEGLPITCAPKTEDDESALLMHCPATEMRNRGWLGTWETPSDLCIQLRAFLGTGSRFASAHFRGSKPGKAHEASLVCWLTKLEIEAERVNVPRFSTRRLKSELPELVRLSVGDRGPVTAVAWLKDRGVRCVFIGHMEKTYLDGATMVLDDAKPAMGLTLRYDRLDNFWFTLLHEIGHIVLHRSELENHPMIDESIEEQSGDEIERQADHFACNAWVSPSVWTDFRRRVRDYPKLQDIEGFASDLQVSPALVAGRLRHELKRYRHYRQFVGENKVCALIRESYPFH